MPFTSPWPQTLVTNRLELRSARERDKEDLISQLADGSTCIFLGGPRSQDDASELIQPPYGQVCGHFVVRERSSDRFVGICGLDEHSIDRPGQ